MEEGGFGKVGFLWKGVRVGRWAGGPFDVTSWGRLSLIRGGLERSLLPPLRLISQLWAPCLSGNT